MSGICQLIFGFKGNWDFGNGLNGFFNFEVYYDMNNGNFYGIGDVKDIGNKFFCCQVNFGVSGDWGSIMLGC